jgi:hypothetical protein
MNQKYPIRVGRAQRGARILRKRRWQGVAAIIVAMPIAGCGGGRSSGNSPTPRPPIVTSLPAVQLSATSPFTAGCDGTVPTGTLYVNAEVEPIAAVNPVNPANIVAAWQQDRWSDDGAHGIVTAASFDSGHTWTRAMPEVSRCAGGTAVNGADYARASDPWLTVAADGTTYLLSLSFTGATLAANATTAMLVTRSTDGGATWTAPITLIRDVSGFSDDKGSITADRLNSHYVYAVWDRLDSNGGGPTFFARTADGGSSWQTAHAIYDPGSGNQTIGNLLLSLPNGTLLVVFTEFATMQTGLSGTLKVMRSTDHGGSWSVPLAIAAELPVGTRDPRSGMHVRDSSDLPATAIDRSGTVYVVWQDSRFSNGERDAIALSSSFDGGATWSPPVRVNGSPAASAFIPNINVRDDGLIGVSYYDLRNDVPSPGVFTADYWLATSLDGLNWKDTHISGPFSLLNAPVAEGLFLGDYQSLGSSGSDFLPVFVISSANTANRTDVFIAFGALTGTTDVLSDDVRAPVGEAARTFDHTPKRVRR